MPRVPSKGWGEMIRKVYEVDPMICPRCGGRMRAVLGLQIDLKFLTLVPGWDILFF